MLIKDADRQAICSLVEKIVRASLRFPRKGRSSGKRLMQTNKKGRPLLAALGIYESRPLVTDPSDYTADRTASDRPG